MAYYLSIILQKAYFLLLSIIKHDFEAISA